MVSGNIFDRYSSNKTARKPYRLHTSISLGIMKKYDLYNICWDFEPKLSHWTVNYNPKRQKPGNFQSSTPVQHAICHTCQGRRWKTLCFIQYELILFYPVILLFLMVAGSICIKNPRDCMIISLIAVDTRHWPWEKHLDEQQIITAERQKTGQTSWNSRELSMRKKWLFVTTSRDY